MAQIYKSTCHTFHTFRTWVIADSLRVTHWNGTSSKGGPGGYGRAGPPQEGERTLHRNKQTRVLCPASQPSPAGELDGAPRRLLPHSIPLGQTFHDDMAPCRMGTWDPQEEWAGPLPVLAECISAAALPRPRRCPFVAPVLTARVGSPAAALFSLPSAGHFRRMAARPWGPCWPLLRRGSPLFFFFFGDLRGAGGERGAGRGRWGGVYSSLGQASDPARWEARNFRAMS